MRRAPAIALFFLSPLVAEFLLGDFTVAQLTYLVLLAPAYGAAAVLIRELTRRTGRGWPTMLVLALAYGLLEEGLETQSLFNPNYLNAHLLDSGYVPALGIAVPWTVFVLTLHTVWSMSVPIALVEQWRAGRRSTPWLGRAGLTIFAILALVGAAGTFAVSYAGGHYLASPSQLAVTALLVIALVVVAFRRPATRRPLAGAAPSPWQILAVTLIGGAIFEEATLLPSVPGIVAVLVAIAAVTVALLRWSRRTGWTTMHTFAAAAGGLLTYAWHSFLATPLAGTPHPLVPISHAAFAALAVTLLLLEYRRLRPALAPAADAAPQAAIPTTAAAS
jgi:hypothetical protein